MVDVSQSFFSPFSYVLMNTNHAIVDLLHLAENVPQLSIFHSLPNPLLKFCSVTVTEILQH